MTQQKALILESAHGQFVVGHRDVPKISPTDLLIKIHSVALNPVDWKIQKYAFAVTEYPAVIGMDAAGTVEAIGEEAQGLGFAVGDKVYVGGQFRL